MNHSKNPKDIPNINLKEFEKCLEDNGINKKFIKENATDKIHNDSSSNQPKKKSVSKTLFKSFSKWCIKNPGLSVAVVLGGSVFIYYKITISMFSQAVFKGNLKTSRYFDKHAG